MKNISVKNIFVRRKSFLGTTLDKRKNSLLTLVSLKKRFEKNMNGKTFVSESGTLVTYIFESENSVVCLTRQQNKNFSISHVTPIEIEEKQFDRLWKPCGLETTREEINFWTAWKNSKPVPRTRSKDRLLQKRLDLIVKTDGLCGIQ